MIKRSPIIVWVFLFTMLWGAVPTAPLADEVRPKSIINQRFDNEAFDTYVNWASEELQEESWLKLSIGVARIPVGLQELSATTERSIAFDHPPRDSWSTGRLKAVDDIAGVGLRVHLPAGFSYELHYGSGVGDNASRFVKSLELDLAAQINRADVSRVYGGVFSWQTPMEGFTLKGGVSQMQLRAEAVTLDAPLWSTAGVDANSRGNLFNSARTWRASAEQKIGNLHLSAEYMQNQINVEFNDQFQASQIGEGYTGRAAYQINDWFLIGSSYSLYYSDRNDKKGEVLAAMGKNPAGAWIRDIGVSARFDFNSHVALQLEGHLMNGLLGVVEGTDEDWRRFGAHMTISF